MEEIDQVVADLEVIEERLIDLAMQVLSNAIDTGSTERPDLEKKISQARRSVAKAREILKPSSTY